jgi:glycosyltransferase involved in cell wall biosynthesis
MKIVYVDQTGQLGGGELAILPWITAHSEGARVILFTDGPFRERLESSGIPVTVLELGSLKDVRRESSILGAFSQLGAMLSLRRALVSELEGADVVYANSQKAFLLSVLAKARGQRLVWHLRDILSTEHFNPWMAKLAVWLANRSASLVIANSHATAEAALAIGADPQRLRVIYDGVSAAPFDSVSATEIARLRSEIGANDGPVFGLFGRLSPWKGQDVFLEALSRIPEARGILVGAALFGEDQHEAVLRQRASRSDLAGRVQFLGFRSDVPALMKSADFIVHASTAAEPFGLVIVEGMLAQKPVIVANAGGAGEIADDHCAVLVDPGSVDALAGCMVDLLRNPSKAKQIAAAGRAHAEQQFSLEALFAGISGALAEVVRRP